jgi:hypothetical protein
MTETPTKTPFPHPVAEESVLILSFTRGSRSRPCRSTRGTGSTHRSQLIKRKTCDNIK